MSDEIREGQNLSETHEKNNPSVKSEAGADLSRRKFTKAGLVAAPVIMTLTSRPVLGGGSYGGGDGKGKNTLSGCLSGNLSKPDDKCVCKPDEYPKKIWKTRKSKWNYTSSKHGKIEWVHYDYGSTKPKVKWGGSDGTKCKDKFGSGYGHEEETFMHVLWKADHDSSYELMAHTIAAYCNAESDLDYGLYPEDVVDKYHKAMAGSYKNHFTERGDDCKTALKKEFIYLNCEDGAQEDYFDCEDSSHWDGDAHNDYMEYKKCKYVDSWSYWQSKDCKDWDEYKSWKYRNYSSSNTSYSYTSSDHSDDYKSYQDSTSSGGWGGRG